MSCFRKIVCGLGLCCALSVSSFAESGGDKLTTLEATRTKVFEILYPQQLKTLEQKRAFLKKYYKTGDEYETFIFPNQTIENVYNAYITAHPKDSFGSSILHKELPKMNKAYRADSNEDRMGYVLMYIWSGDRKLSITNTRIEDDNLCGKELLEFEEQKGQTILKSSFEQYCF